MGVNDIAVRFTEEHYATKNEVSRELKISVIDGVWDKILSYRAPFYHYLSVRGIDKNQLRVCLCPTISSNLNMVEAKLLRIVSEANKLNSMNNDRQYFYQTQLIKSLQNIALANVSLSDEGFVKSVVLGEVQDKSLSNYLSALRFIENKYVNSIDVDFLSTLYSRVTNNSELTSFYREVDMEDANSSAIISRVYKSAPCALVESMMDSLFVFLEKSNVSPLTKSLISYYYVQFVKPFNTHNSEIAVLLAKSVLAHYSLGEFAIYLPFEAILNENEVDINKIFYEVQTTSDVTYFLVYALKFADKEFNKILDGIADYSSRLLKKDFYQVDEVVKPEPVVEEAKPETAPTPVPEPVPAPTLAEVKIPEPEPVKETPVVEKPKAEVEVKTSPIVEKPAGLAVSYIPEELDEKAAQRLEKHLLESDIRLKKGQAKFYARHCTLGMYYTIEQYRKANKCVYETARTAMDKLVEFGYYAKSEYGKKYVYTPVKRK